MIMNKYLQNNLNHKVNLLLYHLYKKTNQKIKFQLKQNLNNLMIMLIFTLQMILVELNKRLILTNNQKPYLMIFKNQLPELQNKMNKHL